MNGYPIVHTSSNPLRVKILAAESTGELEEEIYNFLFTNSTYCEVHDIQFIKGRTHFECLIAYKLKYNHLY